MSKWVEWSEPWYDGVAELRCSVRVEDVIRHQLSKEPRYLTLNDPEEVALTDFLVVHWAVIKEYDDENISNP